MSEAAEVATPGRSRPVTRQGRSGARARFEQIHRELRDRICLRVYPPGTVLSESELAAEFGVSRTPIRRVLSRLEFGGFVEIKHGVGTIVTHMDTDDLADVYALRMQLAALIGVLNPVPPTDRDIAALRQLVARIRARGSELTARQYWEINTAFQFELGRRIGNRALREISERFYFLTNRNWQAMVPAMDWEDEIEHFVREIEDTVRCLEIGDLVGVGMVRRNAISTSFLRLLRYRDAAQGEAPGPREGRAPDGGPCRRSGD